MDRIKISLSKKYDVITKAGALKESGSLIKEVISPCKVCLITDNNVHDLYLNTVDCSLSNAGFDVYKISFPPGEKTKSLESLGQLLEYLADHEFTRTDILVALGGGIIGDLTGFAAATYLRGINFIQIPTSLLAAVDASVGGKTAINLKAGKNLAGAFWQPSMVIFDPETIDTLPHNEYLNGMAEIIKSGVIGDKDLFNLTETPKNDHQFILQCVKASINVKRHLVEEDERDTGERQLLNFGHTIGHAIEKCSNFKISHGHAVAAGMAICARACKKVGWTSSNCNDLLIKNLQSIGLPTNSDFTAKQLAAAATTDKKRQGDTINLIIPLKIGKCAIMKLPVMALYDFIDSGLE